MVAPPLLCRYGLCVSRCRRAKPAESASANAKVNSIGPSNKKKRRVGLCRASAEQRATSLSGKGHASMHGGKAFTLVHERHRSHWRASCGQITSTWTEESKSSLHISAVVCQPGAPSVTGAATAHAVTGRDRHEGVLQRRLAAPLPELPRLAAMQRARDLRRMQCCLRSLLSSLSAGGPAADRCGAHHRGFFHASLSPQMQVPGSSSAPCLRALQWRDIIMHHLSGVIAHAHLLCRRAQESMPRPRIPIPVTSALNFPSARCILLSRHRRVILRPARCAATSSE